ncbi:MAG: metallophosphoesterase [Myxococcales bacterium]|nr:metallophosphoesterase [Myxococcales bacterium]
MRGIPLFLVIASGLAAAAAGCLRGEPIAADFVDTGGSIQVPGCDYALTTRVGAEPPSIGVPHSGRDPRPRSVHLGIMGDPRTSIVAQWRTWDETTLATEIWYAKGEGLSPPQLTGRATGLTFAYRATGTDIIRMHQAHLCNLEPGTTYSYQVGGVDLDGNAAFSPVYSFRTAPDVAAQPDAEVVLGLVGDTRGGYAVWQQLVDQLAFRAPDLIVFTGDAVTIGLTQYEWEEFFDRGEQLLARVPLISAHGNHEVNAVNFYSQVAQPGDQETFGLDYGFAHITVANDTPDDYAKIGGQVRDAIAADFAASDGARWKLFVHHQPMFTSSTTHGSSVTLQEAWLPLVDAHRIDLVVNGHAHLFELTRPLRAKEPQATTDDATVFVVTGGAGAPLYDHLPQPFSAYSEMTYNASVVRVRKDQLVLEAFRQDGTAIPAGLTKTK